MALRTDGERERERERENLAKNNLLQTKNIIMNFLLINIIQLG